MTGFYKAAYRDPPDQQHPQGRIKWEYVDPWLKAVFMVGGASKLEKVLGIPKWTLLMRRREIGLPPLPQGRDLAVEFTSYEQEVRRRLDLGCSYREIAHELKVSLPAVGRAVMKVKEKEKRQANYCHTCKGLGLEECLGCKQSPEGKGSGPHFHVCSVCHGKSVYQPEPAHE